jgi:hypothetical protein
LSKSPKTLSRFCATFAVALLPLASVTADESSIKLIYDGDIGPDPCDFSTISMLHEYHKRGMIELLGVIGETPDPYLASTFSIYNQIYGHDIPIAAYDPEKTEVQFTPEIVTSYYDHSKPICFADQNKTIFETYGNEETLRSKDVFGTVTLYRKLLSEAEDNSVTIYTAGQLYNFPPLIASQADDYSILSGRELLQHKVKEFVVMGGYFPDSLKNTWYIKNTNGAEWNFWGFHSVNTTKNTFDELTQLGKPITYIGAETGYVVRIGLAMAKRLGRHHPTTEAFTQYKLTSKITKGREDEGPILRSTNPAYDELALFYAVEGGVGKYFERFTGSITLDENGANGWVPGEGNESYLQLKGNSKEKAVIIRELRAIITDRVTGNF